MLTPCEKNGFPLPTGADYTGNRNGETPKDFPATSKATMSGGGTIRVPVSLETSYPLLAPSQGVVMQRMVRTATYREEAGNPLF